MCYDGGNESFLRHVLGVIGMFFFGYGLSDKAMVEGPGNKLKGEKMKSIVVGQVLAVFSLVYNFDLKRW